MTVTLSRTATNQLVEAVRSIRASQAGQVAAITTSISLTNQRLSEIDERVATLLSERRQLRAEIEAFTTLLMDLQIRLSGREDLIRELNANSERQHQEFIAIQATVSRAEDEASATRSAMEITLRELGEAKRSLAIIEGEIRTLKEERNVLASIAVVAESGLSQANNRIETLLGQLSNQERRINRLIMEQHFHNQQVAVRDYTTTNVVSLTSFLITSLIAPQRTPVLLLSLGISTVFATIPFVRDVLCATDPEEVNEARLRLGITALDRSIIDINGIGNAVNGTITTVTGNTVDGHIRGMAAFVARNHIEVIGNAINTTVTAVTGNTVDGHIRGIGHFFSQIRLF